MDIRSAELTKYAANAMLATKISFMNELANIAERVGADIEKVRVGIGSDPRIGYSFIYPGRGYGGSCFPKDVKALIAFGARSRPRAADSEGRRDGERPPEGGAVPEDAAPLRRQARGPHVRAVGSGVQAQHRRHARGPGRALMELLLEARRQGARLRSGRDGRGAAHVCGIAPDLTLAKNAYEALAGADALAIVTEWQEFRSPDFDRFKQMLKSPVIFDGRNLYDPSYLARLGITYYGIGRGARLDLSRRFGAAG